MDRKISDKKGQKALVIIGHGATRMASAAASTERLASAMRDRNAFDLVRTAYVNGTPAIDQCLDGLTASQITIIPNFACDGYLSQVVIPKALNLTGRASERIGPMGRQTIEVTRALGSHALIDQIAAKNIRDIQRAHDLPPASVSALFIGHGTPRDPASSQATRGLAERLVRAGIIDQAASTFLDEKPSIETWPDLSKHDQVIVVPFLMSLGKHGKKDVPRRLGLDPENSDLMAALIKGQSFGPIDLMGKKLWLCPPIGTDPMMIDIAMERAGLGYQHAIASCAPQAFD